MSVGRNWDRLNRQRRVQDHGTWHDGPDPSPGSWKPSGKSKRRLPIKIHFWLPGRIVRHQRHGIGVLMPRRKPGMLHVQFGSNIVGFPWAKAKAELIQ
jgi:hypothetical protein